MTYSYPIIGYQEKDELIFLFPDLPSGILCMEPSEQDYAPEQVLAEMLLDEEFLPHDCLPQASDLEKINEVKLLSSFLSKEVSKEKCFKRLVTVDPNDYQE